MAPRSLHVWHIEWPMAPQHVAYFANTILGRPHCRWRPSRSPASLSLRHAQSILATKPTWHSLLTIVRTHGTTCSFVEPRPSCLLLGLPLGNRSFHSSFIQTNAMPWPIALLKTSSAMEAVRVVCRVCMSLLPVMLVRRQIAQGMLLHLTPANPDHIELLKNMVTVTTGLSILLIAVPFSLLLITMVANMERTPLTGRLRVIMLSPQEEEDMARQLGGMAWFNAVADILMSGSSEQDQQPPHVIGVSDWRYAWAEQVLRRLESAIPALVENYYEKRVLVNYPYPQSVRYPLRPRIAAREEDSAQQILGVPYNLLIVEGSDKANGFSYGIGGHNSAGIVLYSGFFDEIGAIVTDEETNLDPPRPTTQQTSQLAVLLAHELAHLVLAHHVETLSSGTIVFPKVLEFAADLWRTIIYPWTMLLGPFLNDHLERRSKKDHGKLQDIHNADINRLFELEADIVSARILACAGFDPRIAVDFWENRRTTRVEMPADTREARLNRCWMRLTETHPLSEERVHALRKELSRWKRPWTLL